MTKIMIAKFQISLIHRTDWKDDSCCRDEKFGDHMLISEIPYHTDGHGAFDGVISDAAEGSFKRILLSDGDMPEFLLR